MVVMHGAYNILQVWISGSQHTQRPVTHREMRKAENPWWCVSYPSGVNHSTHERPVTHQIRTLESLLLSSSGQNFGKTRLSIEFIIFFSSL